MAVYEKVLAQLVKKGGGVVLLKPGEERVFLDVARRYAQARGVPLRAPHFTASWRGMLGSAKYPGEVDLAAGGILLLMGFPEFTRSTLRGSIEEVRARGRNVAVVGTSDEDEPCMRKRTRELAAEMKLPVVDACKTYVAPKRDRSTTVKKNPAPDRMRDLRKLTRV